MLDELRRESADVLRLEDDRQKKDVEREKTLVALRSELREIRDMQVSEGRGGR